jgi:uncharacterized protein (DUF1330 family)
MSATSLWSRRPFESTAARTWLEAEQVSVLEGTWQPTRIVIVRFESVQRAVAWWDSEEYRNAKRMRQRATATNMIVVEGAEEASRPSITERGFTYGL